MEHSNSLNNTNIPPYQNNNIVPNQNNNIAPYWNNNIAPYQDNNIASYRYNNMVPNQNFSVQSNTPPWEFDDTDARMFSPDDDTFQDDETSFSENDPIHPTIIAMTPEDPFQETVNISPSGDVAISIQPSVVNTLTSGGGIIQEAADILSPAEDPINIAVKVVTYGDENIQSHKNDPINSTVNIATYEDINMESLRNYPINSTANIATNYPINPTVNIAIYGDENIQPPTNDPITTVNISTYGDEIIQRPDYNSIQSTLNTSTSGYDPIRITGNILSPEGIPVNSIANTCFPGGVVLIHTNNETNISTYEDENIQPPDYNSIQSTLNTSTLGYDPIRITGNILFPEGIPVNSIANTCFPGGVMITQTNNETSIPDNPVRYQAGEETIHINVNSAHSNNDQIPSNSTCITFQVGIFGIFLAYLLISTTLIMAIIGFCSSCNFFCKSKKDTKNILPHGHNDTQRLNLNENNSNSTRDHNDTESFNVNENSLNGPRDQNDTHVNENNSSSPHDRIDIQTINVNENNSIILTKSTITAIAPCKKDDEVYNMDHENTGDALIFNHENFNIGTGQLKRYGTQKDCNDMKNCLDAYGFEVEVCQDFTYDEIIKKTEQYAKKSHAKKNCFVIVILSHGYENKIFSKDREYSLDKIISAFTADKVPSLAGKPKLFFIQACRGSQFDDGVLLVPKTDSKNIPNTNIFDHTDGNEIIDESYKIATESDFLIYYSTSFQYFSFRNERNGSVFIQSLCEIWMNNDNVEFKKILTAVGRRITTDYESSTGNPKSDKKKQCPDCRTKLIRELYFKKKNLTNDKIDPHSIVSKLIPQSTDRHNDDQLI